MAVGCGGLVECIFIYFIHTWFLKRTGSIGCKRMRNEDIISDRGFDGTMCNVPHLIHPYSFSLKKSKSRLRWLYNVYVMYECIMLNVREPFQSLWICLLSKKVHIRYTGSIR